MFRSNTKFLTKRFPLRAYLTFIFLHACFPKGEMTRQIHPPHKAFQAGTKQLHADGSSNLKRGTPGLPPNCSSSRPGNRSLCLTCSHDEFSIQRCVDFGGIFDPKAVCMHNKDHIKCLMAEGPTGIVVSLRRPCEKLLRENYVLWEETVWSIWEAKLEQNDYDQLSALLKFLNETSLWISQRSLDSIEDYELIAVLPLSPESSHQHLKQARISLKKLEKSRLQGRLNLENFLNEWKRFLEDAGLDRDLLRILDSMSLEGLEEREPLPSQ